MSSTTRLSLVDQDKCIGCKACLGIGCPAISYRDGKAVIDRTQCVGCGVCKSPVPEGPLVRPASLGVKTANLTKQKVVFMNKSVMIVGVGGQGTLLASRILGDAMMSQGFDVKVSEVHGMSQRGGSVVTYVRYGDKVYSPIIETGEADIILAFEQLEAARFLPYLKEGGTVVTSTQQIDPMPVVTGGQGIPPGPAL